METALLHIVDGLESHFTNKFGQTVEDEAPGVWRDAKLLEKCMKGIGTRNDLLTMRIIRAHWDPSYMEAVKAMYFRLYNKTLRSRVEGETNGLYRQILVALIDGSAPSKSRDKK